MQFLVLQSESPSFFLVSLMLRRRKEEPEPTIGGTGGAGTEGCALLKRRGRIFLISAAVIGAIAAVAAAYLDTGSGAGVGAGGWWSECPLSRSLSVLGSSLRMKEIFLSEGWAGTWDSGMDCWDWDPWDCAMEERPRSFFLT